MNRSNEFLNFRHAAMQCLFFAAYDLSEAVDAELAGKPSEFFVRSAEKELGYAEQWINAMKEGE